MARAAERFGLKHPIYLDTDGAYWNALNNSYWPAFYLVDKHGQIRLTSVGEMHAGEDPATRFELLMQRLLAER